MENHKLKKYYKLCKIGMENNPIISNVAPEFIETIFTSNQIKLYLKKSGKAFEINETVIGGKKSDSKILIF